MRCTMCDARQSRITELRAELAQLERLVAECGRVQQQEDMSALSGQRSAGEVSQR